MFNKITLHLENGKSFIINAPNNSIENLYVARAALNSKEYTKNYLNHSDILKGGTFDVTMSKIPNKQKGTLKNDFPYSMTNETGEKSMDE